MLKKRGIIITDAQYFNFIADMTLPQRGVYPLTKFAVSSRNRIAVGIGFRITKGLVQAM